MENFINLKIKPSSKEKLGYIKKKHFFSSFSTAIETMCTFFEINKISPKEGINQSYQNSIFEVKKVVEIGLRELKKQSNKDSQSMRKLLRAIEKDHMINTSSKIGYLYDKKREEVVKSNVENSINAITDSTKNNPERDQEIASLNALIDEKNSEIKALKQSQDSVNSLASKYEEKLKILYRAHDIERSRFGKDKILIDITKEDFDKLFELTSVALISILFI